MGWWIIHEHAAESDTMNILSLTPEGVLPWQRRVHKHERNIRRLWGQEKRGNLELKLRFTGIYPTYRENAATHLHTHNSRPSECRSPECPRPKMGRTNNETEG